MNDTTTRFYLERSLPLRYRPHPTSEARSTPFEGALDKDRRWPAGTTLYVTFMDGDPQVHKRIESYAKQWSQYANITFVFGNHDPSQIRISFKSKLSSSYIGKDCERIPKKLPTMTFGWLYPNSPDEIYSAVVLHEFGHALGMIHEHQSPTTAIQWNKPVVINYFKFLDPPWSEADVESNIFYRYETGQTQFEEFDPHSIMVYRINPGWTLNGWGVMENSVLSQGDKNFIRKYYP